MTKKEGFRYLFIFLRSLASILFSTANIYLIANKYYIASVCISAGISTLWTLNIKDLAISNWKDRLSYIIGGVFGTSISLYCLSEIITK